MPGYDVTRTMIKQAKVPQLTSRGRRSVPTSELSTSLDLFQTEDESLSNDLDEMRDYCRQYIENSTASKMCSSVLNSANYSSRIENCARDMNDTGDKVWAEDSVKDIINECLNEAEKSTPIDDNSTDTPTGSPSDLLEQLTAGLCDQDCGANGQCNAGVCECNEGYTGELCEISKTTKPTVLSSNFDQEACGTCGCDVQETADCSTVVVYGNNFVDSETLTCFYKYVQVSDSVKVVSGFRQVRANFVSLHQVTCDLPEAKGSALVQISNDGTTLSDDVYLHVVYDSRCHDCIVHNETMASNCTQRDNVCIINGVCHTSNENKDNDNCRICEPSTDPYTWTISANKDCASEYLKVRTVEKDDKQPIAVPILAALSAFLGALLIITVFCLCKQSERGKKAGQSGKYEVTANPYVDITKSQDDKL